MLDKGLFWPLPTQPTTFHISTFKTLDTEVTSPDPDLLPSPPTPAPVPLNLFNPHHVL